MNAKVSFVLRWGVNNQYVLIMIVVKDLSANYIVESAR
jgi:hypothetical protein